MPIPTENRKYNIHIKKYRKLPGQLKEFIEVVEDYVGVPVKGIGIGPERDQFIMR